MLAPRTPRSRPTDRRGAILLVVLTLLALFAVVGLSIALYAEAEATAARIKREAVDDRAAAIDPTEYVNKFLGQLIYGPKDTGTAAEVAEGITSDLRGHDLAGLMYGANPEGSNVIPYNGIGIFSENPLTIAGLNIDRREVIRHSYAGNSEIVDPMHTGIRAANTANSTTWYTGRSYVGKNGPWTYPDRTNLAVAMINPSTGQVIIPSFHRPTLFNPNRDINNAGNATTNAASWLAPPSVDALGAATNLPNHDGLAGNSQWLNSSGTNKYRILRPRPEDHRHDTGDGQGNVTQFPYPPMNPDGTYTGDLQNWKWADGIQKNDSVWLKPHMPVFNYKGRRVTALVAPLVVPLDGRISALVAGNIRGTSQAHASNQGFGPWEVNLAHVLNRGTTATANPPTGNAAEEAKRLVAWRKGNTPQAVTMPGNPSTYPTPYNPTLITTAIRGTSHTSAAIAGTSTSPNYPPGYSAVDWDGAGDGSKLTLPTGTMSPTATQSDPTWPTARYGNSDTTATTGEVLNHPSLFNPYAWGGSTAANAGRTFPYADVRRQLTRYSYEAGAFANGPLHDLAPDSFTGTWNGSQWETRPGGLSNLARALTTPISNSLKRPTWMPNFPSYGSYTMPTGQPAPSDSQATVRTLPVTPPTLALGPQTDFGGTAANPQVQAAHAAYGAVDLNRKLKDYRGPNPTGALLPSNVSTGTNYMDAWRDRHVFAQEIFARLVFVTGAHYLTYNSTNRTFTFANTNLDEFNATRWLAQLAVNIVDYIDEDDISTPFVWNPDPGTVTDPIDPTTGAANFSDSGIVNARVVFGVEKPRLVLHEVYSEMVTAPSEVSAQNATNFHVRFWAELVNPGNDQPTSYVSGNGPLGEGQVRLRYNATEDGAAGDYAPYQIQVFNDTQAPAVNAELTNPGNPTGSGGIGVTPAFTTTFSDTSAGPPERRMVYPSNGAADASLAGMGIQQGFAVVGTATDMNEPPGWTFRPDQGTPVPTYPGGNTVIPITDNMAINEKMYYQIPAQPQASLAPPTQNVVLLRRLACPYLRPNDPANTAPPAMGGYDNTQPINPYITVDYMSQVPSRAAVKRASDSNGTDVPVNMNVDRASIGRQQPFYGIPTYTPITPPTSTDPGTPADQYVKNTFFKQNDNPLTPFDWLVHLDRRLINPIELRHVSAVRPHELTNRFVQAPMMAGDPPLKFRHTGGWFTANTNLFRAFEGLTTKPWTHAVPEGGRTPGRVNINMIWDPKVLLALLDPHDSTSTTNPHGFDTTHVYDPNEALSTSAAMAKSLWVKLFAGTDPNLPTRTRNFPNVGVTIDETTTNQDTTATVDRPFKGLGVATYLPTSNTARTENGLGIQDTILRYALPTSTPSDPLILLPDNATTPLHPYERDEMLRKLFNQITTVSDTYLVLMTVGFFEVRAEVSENGVTRVVLGQEVNKETPGDLRVQYAAIVDRTALAVTNTNAWNNATPPQQPDSPIWFTEVAETAAVGATSITVYAHQDSSGQVGVYSDGTFYPLTAGSLRIGTGNSAETVTVSNVGTLNTTDGAGGPAGTVTLTVGATTSPHEAGSAVTAADRIPGSPGPQPGFDFNNAKYKGVVPFVARLTP